MDNFVCNGQRDHFCFIVVQLLSFASFILNSFYIYVCVCVSTSDDDWLQLYKICFSLSLFFQHFSFNFDSIDHLLRPISNCVFTFLIVFFISTLSIDVFRILSILKLAPCMSCWLLFTLVHSFSIPFHWIDFFVKVGKFSYDKWASAIHSFISS